MPNVSYIVNIIRVLTLCQESFPGTEAFGRYFDLSRSNLSRSQIRAGQTKNIVQETTGIYGGERVQLEENICVIQVLFFGQKVVPIRTGDSTVMIAMTASPLKPPLFSNVKGRFRCSYCWRWNSEMKMGGGGSSRWGC